LAPATYLGSQYKIEQCLVSMQSHLSPLSC
jgi:hypothetical protein